MSNIIDSIQLSGVTYTLQGSGGGGNPTVELTQAQYDALVSAGTVASDTYYIITDATPADVSQYWTSAQTQSAINAAVSGKVDTSTYNTYTASTDTAIQGKQDTLVSGTNIKTINNESILGSGNIDIHGGGGGGTVESAITSGSTNAVESSAIYDATHVDLIDLWTSTDSSNLRDTTQSLYKFYVQYSGDTALDEQVSVQIRYGSNNTWETLYGNVFQETATTSSVFTSTFDNGKWIIESSSPNYIGQIYTDYRLRIWSYNRTIGNKFAADSIENDIIPYIGDVVTKAENAVANAGLTSNGSKGLGIFFDKGNGNTSNVMVTLDDLKYSDSNQTLSTDIQIPTGEVDWMDFTPTSNCLAGDIPTNKVKVTYSGQTVSASNRRISFRAYFIRTDGNPSSYYPQITWSDTTTPVVNGCSAVTATYDSTDDSVIIELPNGETTYDGNTGTFSIKNFRSDSCQFGTGISSVKCYGDITEDIYTAMAHKQDTLSAGTGISIVDNVISATGGGGLKLVKLSQSEYDSLATKDNSTLYVIVN